MIKKDIKQFILRNKVQQQHQQQDYILLKNF